MNGSETKENNFESYEFLKAFQLVGKKNKYKYSGCLKTGHSKSGKMTKSGRIFGPSQVTETQTTAKLDIFLVLNIYNGLGTFDFSSVVKQFGFRHLSEIQTILVGFWHCPKNEQNCSFIAEMV